MSFFKNIIYDFKAINEFGLITHLKYLFDSKKVIVNLHINLDYLKTFRSINSLKVIKVDHKSKEILEEWCEIINDAHENELKYDLDSAWMKINLHPYLNISDLFFLFKKENLIGTYFVGSFKNNDKIIGGGRLAIRKKYQNLGFGFYLLHYALNLMKERGFKHAELIFYSQRLASMEMAFNCGAYPEYRQKYLQLKSTRKSIFIKLLIKHRINKLYNRHIDNLNSNFK
jgi:GNAT superfamily N-acetyltransferase